MNVCIIHSPTQSNGRGVELSPVVSAGGFADLGVRFFRDITTSGGTNQWTDDAITTLQTTVTETPYNGIELQLCKSLVAGGLTGSDITYIKVTGGGLPLDPNWAANGTANHFQRLVNALKICRPQGPTRYILVVDQGESEATGGVGAATWAAEFRRFKANVESLVGQRVYVIVILTRAVLGGGATSEATVIAQQLLVADATVTRDDLGTIADAIHDDGPATDTKATRVSPLALAALTNFFPRYDRAA